MADLKTSPVASATFSLKSVAMMFGLVVASVVVTYLLLTTSNRINDPAQPVVAVTPAVGASASVQPPAATDAPTRALAAAEVAAESEDDAEATDGVPPLQVEPPILDFGIVRPSVTAEGTVKLINTGTTELEILTVQAGCKCTTIDDISGKKIAPGGSIDLKVAMKAQSSPGTKRAELKILVDGFTQVVMVNLQNEVSLPVRVSPAYLNVVADNPKTGRIVVESIDKVPFKICSVGGKPPNLVGFDAEKDEPRNQYLVDWDFARDFDPNNTPRYWVIETDRADCPLLDVFVRHESTLPKPVLRLTEYRHTFGRIEEGVPFEFTIDITDLPATERIVTAASSSSAAAVELVGSEVEGNVTHVNLRLKPVPGTLGVQWVPFNIYTNSRQQTTAIWGQIVPKGTVGCFGR